MNTALGDLLNYNWIKRTQNLQDCSFEVKSIYTFYVLYVEFFHVPIFCLICNYWVHLWPSGACKPLFSEPKPTNDYESWIMRLLTSLPLEVYLGCLKCFSLEAFLRRCIYKMFLAFSRHIRNGINKMILQSDRDWHLAYESQSWFWRERKRDIWNV